MNHQNINNKNRCCHWNYFFLAFLSLFLLFIAQYKTVKKMHENLYFCINSVWKSPKKSHFWFFNFGIFYQLLSGNTVWPRALGFRKLVKIFHFWHFSLPFVYSICKRSSLRSQCWMRLFGRFLHTLNFLLLTFICV